MSKVFSEIKGVVGRPTEEVGCWTAFMRFADRWTNCASSVNASYMSFYISGEEILSIDLVYCYW